MQCASFCYTSFEVNFSYLRVIGTGDDDDTEYDDREFKIAFIDEFDHDNLIL